MSFNSKADILNLAIRQLARDYYIKTKPDAVAIAPIAKPLKASDGTNFQYSYLKNHGSLLTGRLARLTTESQSLTQASITIDTENFSVDAIDVGEFLVSDSTLDAFEATYDETLVDRVVRNFRSKLYAEHSLTVKDAALNNLQVERAAIDDSLDAAIGEYVRQVQLSCGQKPNTIYMGETLVSLIAEQDFIFRGSGNSEAITGDRRVGYATDADVAAYFKRRHGLELFVDSSHWRPSAQDDVEFVFAQHAIIGSVDPEDPDKPQVANTMHTFVQYEADQNGLMRTEVRRNAAGRLGINVGGEGFFSCHATSPETGLVLDFSSGYSS